MKALFLHPPSFDGYDGGAGARYRMKREVRSWYPTWLAQPAAFVEGSKLIDAPPRNRTLDDIVSELKGRDFVVMHNSTRSFESDLKTAEIFCAQEETPLESADC
jgi:hypothetical protein